MSGREKSNPHNYLANYVEVNYLTNISFCVLIYSPATILTKYTPLALTLLAIILFK